MSLVWSEKELVAYRRTKTAIAIAYTALESSPYLFEEVTVLLTLRKTGTTSKYSSKLTHILAAEKLRVLLESITILSTPGFHNQSTSQEVMVIDEDRKSIQINEEHNCVRIVARVDPELAMSPEVVHMRLCLLLHIIRGIETELPVNTVKSIISRIDIQRSTLIKKFSKLGSYPDSSAVADYIRKQIVTRPGVFSRLHTHATNMLNWREKVRRQLSVLEAATADNHLRSPVMVEMIDRLFVLLTEMNRCLEQYRDYQKRCNHIYGGYYKPPSVNQPSMPDNIHNIHNIHNINGDN